MNLLTPFCKVKTVVKKYEILWFLWKSSSNLNIFYLMCIYIYMYDEFDNTRYIALHLTNFFENKLSKV